MIRVVVWIWHPSWDDSRAVYASEASGLRSHDRLWNYDLTETRLVVLWVSLHTESPAWLRHIYHRDPLMFGQLSIPNWALPAFSPRYQNPEQMFELARKLRDSIEWDKSLLVLQNAEDFWDMPPGLFMAWVFAWKSSWVRGPGKSFSCRIIKDKQYENGEQRLHFLPCLDYGRGHSIYEGDFELHVFGNPHDRNRCVFAFDEIPNLDTNSGGSPQHKLVVGSNTPISDLHPTTLADRFNIREMREAMKMMWKPLSHILNANPWFPPPPRFTVALTEPHTPTTFVSTSQQASPTGSLIELAPLSSANEITQPDSDETPQRQSSTNNNQNPPNAPSP